MSRLERVHFLDGITIGVALMFGNWIFGLQSAMANAADAGLADRAITFLVPTQNVVLLALVVCVYTTCRPKDRMSYPTGGLLLVGAVLYTVSQVAVLIRRTNTLCSGLVS